MHRVVPLAWRPFDDDAKGRPTVARRWRVGSSRSPNKCQLADGGYTAPVHTKGVGNADGIGSDARAVPVLCMLPACPDRVGVMTRHAADRYDSQPSEARGGLADQKVRLRLPILVVLLSSHLGIPLNLRAYSRLFGRQLRWTGLRRYSPLYVRALRSPERRNSTKCRSKLSLKRWGSLHLTCRRW
jgi:hypothetical protein